LFCLAACAQQPPAMLPPADLKAQIDANNAAWSAAANRGDAAGLAAMYTENATMLPPTMDIQRGRAAIQQTVEGLGKAGIRDFALMALDVSQVGPDTAREIGRFTARVPGPKKRLVPIAGKYVVIWELVGGRWMLDVDIWNLNK
jgi:uncharacterized protein (TIGR02246 family)